MEQKEEMNKRTEAEEDPEKRITEWISAASEGRLEDLSGAHDGEATEDQEKEQLRKLIGELTDTPGEETGGVQSEADAGNMEGAPGKADVYEAGYAEPDEADVYEARYAEPGEAHVYEARYAEPGEAHTYEAGHGAWEEEGEEPPRKRILPWLLFAVLILCIAAAYAYITYIYQIDKAEQQARSDAIEKDANPYRVELARLRTELEARQKELTWTSDQAMIMVGFTLTSADDADYISELAETYEFSPVAVIDCTLADPEGVDGSDEGNADLSEITELIDLAAGLGWEIMLTASDFTEETNTVICVALSYMEENEIEESGIFLLRNDFATDENIAQLLADGFLGYTVFHSETPECGQTEDGSIYFEYYYAEQTADAITNKLSSMHQAEAAMIFCIDMEKVNDGTVRDSFVKNFLTRAKAYVDQYDDCVWATVAEVVEELSAITANEEQALAEYEAYLEETEERIAELEEIIAEIYAAYGE